MTLNEPVDPNLVRRLQKDAGDKVANLQEDRKRDGELELDGEEVQVFAQHAIAIVMQEEAQRRLVAGQLPFDAELEEKYREAIFARMFGAGRLQDLLDDTTIENIDINGCDEVWITRAGGARVRAASVAESDEELIENIQMLANYAGMNARPWDLANPQLDLQLPDGSRLAAVMGVSARPAVSIRRHRYATVELKELVANETLTQDAADFLVAAVKARCNIMIAGATNSGKTTMLRALASNIGPEERILTVEKALEIGLRKDPERHPDVVEFEERVANSEGLGAITMQDLVRRTLRMNPSRVIVGEVLGDEVITMLNAMGQGNDGSMSTIHARSARDVFNRIAGYAIQGVERLPHEASYQLIAGGLDYVLFLDHDLASGARRLVTILEVSGFDEQVQASDIFQAQERGGTAVWTGVVPKRVAQLEANGWNQPYDGGGWR